MADGGVLGKGSNWHFSLLGEGWCSLWFDRRTQITMSG